MTRWSSPDNYEGHKTVVVWTLANKSSMFWPTLNCSNPDNASRVVNYIRSLVGSANMGQAGKLSPAHIPEAFEMVHKGASDVRVYVGAIEGVANESLGKILMPGEVWSPPYRNFEYMTFYTSSNVSQEIHLTLLWYM